MNESKKKGRKGRRKREERKKRRKKEREGEIRKEKNKGSKYGRKISRLWWIGGWEVWIWIWNVFSVGRLL